jgi:Lon protease-like protein
MRRTLPHRANLEHLKKQAKDLLDGHKRADPEALARIRDAVPAFASASDEAITKAPFALHDAQSAIAREYGKKSWNELRQAVETQSSDAPELSDATLRALMPMPFPPEVGALMREASGRRVAASATAQAPLAKTLPLVTLRNAMLLPRAIAPIHVGRPPARAAIDVALGRKPPTIAVFTQRSHEDEAVDEAALYPIGCEAYVLARLPDGPEQAWVVLEGVRWLALEALDVGPGECRVARVKAVARDAGDPDEIAPIAASLRAHVRDLASAFPDAASLVARVDAATPEELADLVVANLPVPIAEKARYAEEPRLVERLRMAMALAGR